MSKSKPVCKACGWYFPRYDDVVVIYNGDDGDRDVYHRNCVKLHTVEALCFTQEGDYIGQVAVGEDIMSAYNFFDNEELI